jgi:flagellar motor switch protein FliN/FliY
MNDDDTAPIPEDEASAPNPGEPDDASAQGPSTPDDAAELNDEAAAALAAAQRAIADAMGAGGAEAEEEEALSEARRSVEESRAAVGRVVGHGLPADSPPVAFAPPSFSPSPPVAETAEIQLLGDVNVDVRIELGRTRMHVEDVLRLSAGAVVELEKLAGDPVDVYVNGRHVARGEVLVLNENFCVRVNEVLEPLPANPNAG